MKTNTVLLTGFLLLSVPLQDGVFDIQHSLQAAAPLQKTSAYTIEEAIGAALKNNRGIINARLEVEKSDAQVKEAFSYALPSVNVNASFTHNIIVPKSFIPSQFFNPSAPEGEFTAVEFTPANSYNAAVELNQTLFNAAVFTGIGTSKVYADIAREAVRSKIVQTVASVKKAFYNALVAKEAVELFRASVENAEKNNRQVQVLFQQGLAPEYDALRAEVAVDNLRPSLLEAESNYDNALNALKVVLGVPISEQINLTGSLAEPAGTAPTTADILKKVEDENFDLRTLRLQERFQQEAVAVYKADYLPKLSGFINYANFSQASSLNFTPISTSAAGLRLSLSLFNGFQTDAKVEQALADVEKVRTQSKEATDALKAQAFAALQRLQTAQQRLSSLSRTVQQAERGYTIASSRYNNGIGAQIEIADSELSLRQARLNRLQALLDLHLAQADLALLTGEYSQEYEAFVQYKQ